MRIFFLILFNLLTLTGCLLTPNLSSVDTRKISTNQYTSIHEAINLELGGYIAKSRRYDSFVRYDTKIQAGPRDENHKSMVNIMRAICDSFSGVVDVYEGHMGNQVACESMLSDDAYFAANIFEMYDDNQEYKSSIAFNIREAEDAKLLISKRRELESNKKMGWSGQVKFVTREGDRTLSYRAILDSNGRYGKQLNPLFLQFSLRNTDDKFIGLYNYNEILSAIQKNNIWTLSLKNNEKVQGLLRLETETAYLSSNVHSHLYFLTENNTIETVGTYAIKEIAFGEGVTASQLQSSLTSIRDVQIERQQQIELEKDRLRKKEQERKMKERLQEINQMASYNSIGKQVCKDGNISYSGKRYVGNGYVMNQPEFFDQKGKLIAFIEGASPDKQRLKLRISNWTTTETILAEPMVVPFMDNIKADASSIIWDEVGNWYFCN